MTDILSQLQPLIIPIIIIVGIIILIAYFLKIKSKTVKVIKRSDIEKKSMVNEMKYNPSYEFKKLWHGNNLIGKIDNFAEFSGNPFTAKMVITDANEKVIENHILDAKNKTELIEIEKEYKKKYFDTKKQEIIAKIEKNESLEYELPLKFRFDILNKIIGVIIRPTVIRTPIIDIFNPFKQDVIFFGKNNAILEYDKKNIIIPRENPFNFFEGAYFTLGDADHILPVIKEGMYKTDRDLIASEYFVKSQEQASFSRDGGLAYGLKEKELEIELAKKSGKTTTL